jgi:hypothetical protein
VQYFDSEGDAFDAERFLISFYGRRDIGTGCLANLTDGGEGTSGIVNSEATREKKRLARLGKPSRTKGMKFTRSDEFRRRVSDSKKGNTYTLGMKWPPEVIERMRIAARKWRAEKAERLAASEKDK